MDLHGILINHSFFKFFDDLLVGFLKVVIEIDSFTKTLIMLTILFHRLVDRLVG